MWRTEQSDNKQYVTETIGDSYIIKRLLRNVYELTVTRVFKYRGRVLPGRAGF